MAAHGGYILCAPMVTDGCPDADGAGGYVECSVVGGKGGEKADMQMRMLPLLQPCNRYAYSYYIRVDGGYNCTDELRTSHNMSNDDIHISILSCR